MSLEVKITVLKKSYFNKGLFLSNLKRYWPVWFIYLFVQIISIPVNTISSSPTIYDVTAGLLNVGWSEGAILAYTAAICAIVCTFNFLYSPKQSGLIASLPINRASVFLSSYLSGFSAVTAANIITFIISIIVELQGGMLEISYLLKWLALATLFDITFFGFAVFCAMLTSNIVVLPIIYFVLSITAYAVDVVGRSLLESIIFGLSLNDSFLIYLSPIAALLSHTPHTYYAYEKGYEQPIVVMGKELWIMLGVYSLIGLILVFVALFIYKRHRMESATDVVAIDFLKPVFKYCMTFGVSLIFTTWMYEFFYSGVFSSKGLLTLILLAIMGAVIGYFSSLMMIKKTLNVFKENKLGLYISIGIIICALLICKMDILQIEGRIPELNNVKSVSFNINGTNAYFEEKDNIQKVIDLQQDILANKDIYSARTGSSSTFSIIYYLEDGSSINRLYRLSDTDDSLIPEPLLTTSENILNLKEAKISRTIKTFDPNLGAIYDCGINYYSGKNNQYETLYLSYEEFMDFYNTAILLDIEEGNLGTIWMVPQGDAYNSMYAMEVFCSLEFYPENAQGNYTSDYLYLTVTKDSVNTLNWLFKNTDITPVTMAEYYNNI